MESPKSMNRKERNQGAKGEKKARTQVGGVGRRKIIETDELRKVAMGIGRMWKGRGKCGAAPK
jgi:hypothetical protein